MSRTFGWALLLSFWLALPCAAQSQGIRTDGGALSSPGNNALEFWAEGSKDISHAGGFFPGVAGINAWGVGLRFERVVTAAHGPGFLRGYINYVADLAPATIFYQPGGANYAFSMKPLGMKWVLEKPRAVTPWVEIAGGVLLAQRSLPPGTQAFNFTGNGGFGLRWNRAPGSPSLAVEFFHLSNATLARSNPGVNLAQFRMGIRLAHWPR